MRIFNGKKDGGDQSIKLGVWASGDGKMPQQAQKSTNTWDATIDGVKVKFYHNVSKSNVNYYYVQVDGKWMWTRDDATIVTVWTAKAPVKVAKVEEVKK